MQLGIVDSYNIFFKFAQVLYDNKEYIIVRGRLNKHDCQ